VAFPLTITTQAAFGADLTADPDTWSWTDISAYVRYAPGVTISRGRSDEAQATQPSTLQLVLDNTDGRFTPYNATSAYWPYVRRNTPVRVLVDDGSGEVSRGVFYVDTWPLEWHPSGRERHVNVSASGILQRIAQRSTRPPDQSLVQQMEQAGRLKSPLRRSIGGDDALVAYWPCEDGSQSESLANVAGGLPLYPYGDPQLASESTLLGSDPLPTLQDDQGWRAVVEPRAVMSEWTVSFLVRLETETAFSNAALLYVHTDAGTIREWQVVVSTGSPCTIRLLGMTTPGNQGSDTLSGASLNLVDPSGVEMIGRWLWIEFGATQAGTSLEWRFQVSVPEQTLSVGGTETSTTIANPTEIDTKHNQVGDVAMGHLAVYSEGTSRDHFEAMSGWAGEIPRDRIDRLCAEEGIPVEAENSYGADGVNMGVQGRDSIQSVLEEAAATGGGVLVERLTGGLGYVFGPDRYNAAVDMVLDYASGEVAPGLVATDDDQRLRNEVTASRPSGSSATARDVDHIADHGLYDASISVNPLSDGSLPDYAAWAVHLGTVRDLRVTSLVINLRRSSVADWLGCDIWSRIQVTNPPPELPTGEDIDVHIEGYTETITPHDWRVQLNTSPAAPWQVMDLDASGNASRANTAGCELLTPLSETGTSIVAAPLEANDRWSTSSVPYDLDVFRGGTPGERVTATAVSHTACTYVGAGTGVHGENTSLTPEYHASIQPGDLVLLFAAIRDTAAAVVAPTGWEALHEAGHLGVYGKLYSPTLSRFEVDAEEWSPTGGTAARSTAQQHGDTASLLLTVSGSPSQAYVRHPFVAVTPGTTYYVSFWVYSPSGYADAGRAVDYFDSAGAYLSGTYPGGVVLAAATWTQFTFTSTAPVGAAYAAYGPTLGTNPPNGTTLYLDDVEFSALPTVAFTGGGAGDTTSAQCAVFRGAQARATYATSQANASAQNIAYPAGFTDRDRELVVWFGWKADDWTSVSGPGTEIGEPDTVTGDDQGITWAYQIQTTVSPPAAGSFTVTGGTSAVSRGGVLAIPCDAQTITVTRAVNEVSRAWDPGDGLRLWKPSVLGM
jgi:hypothetical protein